MTQIIIFYIVINIVAFLMYGNDKSAAKKDKWRIPESTLVGVALAGGAFGAYGGMKFFHHKTKHKKFTILVPLSCVLHIAIIIFLIIHFVF